MSNGSYPQDAVYGGWNGLLISIKHNILFVCVVIEMNCMIFELDEPLYVARIHVTSNGMAGLISGSLYPKDGIVHAASNGMIVQNSNYEVLAHCIAEWYEGSLLKSFPGQNKVVIGESAIDEIFKHKLQKNKINQQFV